MGFDALCSTNQTVNESQNSSRRGSVVSVQVRDKTIRIPVSEIFFKHHKLAYKLLLTLTLYSANIFCPPYEHIWTEIAIRFHYKYSPGPGPPLSQQHCQQWTWVNFSDAGGQPAPQSQ